MLYFYNEEIKSLYSTVEIEDVEKSKKYIADMKKQKYVVVSEKEYDKISERLAADLQKMTEDYNNEFWSERKEAIADAKKLGWTDVMVKHIIGKAE